MTWMALCISAVNCGKLMTRRESAFIITQPKMHFWPNYMHWKPIMAELSNPHPCSNNRKSKRCCERELLDYGHYVNLEPRHVTLLPPTLIYLYCYLIPPRDLPRRRANAQHERVTHPIALGRCASPKYFKCLACRYAEASKKQIIWAPRRVKEEKKSRVLFVCASLMCLKYTWWALYNYAAATARAAVLCVWI